MGLYFHHFLFFFFLIVHNTSVAFSGHLGTTPRSEADTYEHTYMHTCKYMQAHVQLHKYSYKQTGSRSPKSSCPCRGYVCVSVSPKAFLLSHLPKGFVSNCCTKRKHICLDLHRIALCITTATWKKRPHKDLDSSHLAEMSERKGGQLL